jgi:hypothetical protein
MGYKECDKVFMCLPQIGKGKKLLWTLMRRVGINTGRLLMMNLKSFSKETHISPGFQDVCSMCGMKIIISRCGCHTSLEHTLMMQIGTFVLIPFCWT